MTDMVNIDMYNKLIIENELEIELFNQFEIMKLLNIVRDNNTSEIFFEDINDPELFKEKTISYPYEKSV